MLLRPFQLGAGVHTKVLEHGASVLNHRYAMAGIFYFYLSMEDIEPMFLGRKKL